MGGALTLCDLTQSYSEKGGGIRTYLTEKRAYIDTHTPHRHVLIIPGDRDERVDDGRHTTIHIASPRVPGSPNYRLLLRSRAVIRALRKQQPSTIECLDAYNLPWAAISYRREVPDVSLIAGYRTDFPTAYVETPLSKFAGSWLAGKAKRKAYNYAGRLYSHFDGVYALNAKMAKSLEVLGPNNVQVLPLGIDLNTFHPNKRDENWRASIGAKPTAPIFVYAGRIDKEKQADVVVDAFLGLPKTMDAFLVMLGEGKLKTELERKTKGRRVFFPGFVSDRSQLSKILASSDIYVSAMAFETFGISIIEAQATGLPVVGVAAGAMIDRVPPNIGVLGPVNDAQAMSANLQNLWMSGHARSTGQRARQHVEKNFAWTKTFEYLFGQIYPSASGREFIS